MINFSVQVNKYVILTIKQNLLRILCLGNMNIKIYGFLFLRFFLISLFIVGGGIAMLPAIEQIFVKKNKLITEEDFVDMVAMTQTVPGLIAINSAIFVGHKVAGVLGCIFSVLGVIFPSLIIIVLLAKFFPLLAMDNSVVLTCFDCVRAAVTGIFLLMFLQMFRKIVKSLSDVFVVVLLAGVLLFKVPVGIVISLSLILGVFYIFYKNVIGSKKT